MSRAASALFPMIIYRRIRVQDHEYELEKGLRNRVLRLPLGLVLSEQDVREEDQQIHLVAMDSRGQVVGCALVAFNQNAARIRQMAVDESCQGQGIGTELVRRAEEAVRARNVRAVTLHARVSARGFYECLGYTATSEPFMEVSIPHIAMEKNLTPTN
jgi:predicted GNAT family N-acyltransferase